MKPTDRVSLAAPCSRRAGRLADRGTGAGPDPTTAEVPRSCRARRRRRSPRDRQLRLRQARRHDPMRDGVKLHTVILVPKGAKGAPILFTRTPYDANALTSHAHSAHLGLS